MSRSKAVRSTKSRPKRSATTRASWSWRRMPRSTSTTPVGRPCSRAAATPSSTSPRRPSPGRRRPRRSSASSARGYAVGRGPSAPARSSADRSCDARPRRRLGRRRRTRQRLAWRNRPSQASIGIAKGPLDDLVRARSRPVRRASRRALVPLSAPPAELSGGAPVASSGVRVSSGAACAGEEQLARRNRLSQCFIGIARNPLDRTPARRRQREIGQR